MKEDIKILEDYIKLINKGYCEDCNELCNIHSTPVFPSRAIKQAIENLLKAYKDVKGKELEQDATIENMKDLSKLYEEDEAVIEEMAEYIGSLDTDEDICKEVKFTSNELGDCEIACKDCIKEYFRNKARKENKE